jgi:Ni/Fe-hydrogenase subunit HybB-like protein
MRAPLSIVTPVVRGADLVEPAAPVGGKIITKVTVALAAIAALGFGVMVYRFVYGLGAATNLNQGYPWGLWIAWDDVVGTALGCGGFATALMVFVMNRGEYHPLVRPAVLAALLGYMMAGISVVADLGRWWSAWHMFWPSYAQTSSVLFQVAICIGAYCGVAMIELAPAVLERFHRVRLLKWLNQVLFIVVALGVLFPVLHQSSMGSLLIIFGPQIHPLYQTAWLPLFYVVSALGMGFAAVTIEGAISSSGLKRPFEKEILGRLLRIGRWVMGAFIVMRFADLAWRGALHYAFEPTLVAAMFWLETALFSVPLWLLAKQAQASKARLIFYAAMAMALGGVVYRFSSYLVAYETGAGWRYFPSLGEMAVTVGLIAAEVLAVILAVRLLPILPAIKASRSAS